MKLNGIIGKGTGKLGSSVFAISGGVQIMREYNPVVSNPNTEAQIAQRAKLKLMSQLGAALAPALGFAKKGLVSARNQFVSKNIGLATYEDSSAGVTLSELQLTPSNAAFPSLIDPTLEGGVMSVALSAAAPASVKRVVYAVYRVNTNEEVEYIASKVVSEAGVNSTFPTTFNNISGMIVVYAYGVKDNTTAATIKYENMVADGATDEASVAIIELFRTAGYDLTKTVGITTSF